MEGLQFIHSMGVFSDCLVEVFRPAAIHFWDGSFSFI